MCQYLCLCRHLVRNVSVWVQASQQVVRRFSERLLYLACDGPVRLRAGAPPQIAQCLCARLQDAVDFIEPERRRFAFNVAAATATEVRYGEIAQQCTFGETV